MNGSHEEILTLDTNNCLISVMIAAGRTEINDTLESLKRQTLKSENYEIIVVSEIEKLQSVENQDVKFIQVETGNPAVKRNTGVSSAQGKILAFIDDDALAPDDWLERGFLCLRTNPSYCGVGGPNLLPPNANRKEQLTNIILNCPLLGSGHISYSSKFAVREAKLGEIHLCNLFVWKNVFLDAGGLNEYVGYGGEDTEFLYQVKKKFGKVFLYSSEIYVYHHRREFGWSYVKQRFKLRTNNGRLTWAYPKLYSRNLKFSLPIIGILAYLLIIIRIPLIILPTLAIYIVVTSVYTTIRHRDFFPILIFALFAHHFTYAAGIFYGLLLGAVQFRRTLRIRR